MIVPMLFMYMTLENKHFIGHMAIIFGFVLIVAGGAGFALVLVGLFFLVPAVAMGTLYKKEYAAPFVILGSVLTIIVELLLMFALLSLGGLNIIASLESILRESFSTMSHIMPPYVDDAYVDYLIFTVTQLIPSAIIMIALFFTLVTHSVARRVLAYAEYDLPSLPPVRTWMLPKSIVWLYIGVLLINLFTHPEAMGSMYTMVIYNLVLLLTIAFCVQAISFLFYLSYVKGWNNALPIIGIVGCFYFSMMFSILGVFDLILDLRSKISGNQRRG